MNGCVPFVLDRALLTGGVVKWIDIDFKGNSNTIMVGASGSGKSVLSLAYASKAARFANHFGSAPAKVWLLDPKGDDTFDRLRGKAHRHYRHLEALQGLRDYHAEYQDRMAGNPDRRYMLLWCEELAMLELSVSRKESEEIRAMMSNILMGIRGVGGGVLISVQRASAELLALGARDNLHTAYGMSVLSKESAATLGFERDRFLTSGMKIGSGHMITDGNPETQRPIQAPFYEARDIQHMQEILLPALNE